ncbi:hypothetical protein HPB50_022831 [Hyalomma asiaticum]|uniref:Uncharacterized protein n=1 Tax=Hyalomma asiaticum TaxID=266040 RepID=A0ACB7SZ65_HYAAI|nr:hypothetical protein HPB50_022831 [Hyalomma asiaticum]
MRIYIYVRASEREWGAGRRESERREKEQRSTAPTLSYTLSTHAGAPPSSRDASALTRQSALLLSTPLHKLRQQRGSFSDLNTASSRARERIAGTRGERLSRESQGAEHEAVSALSVRALAVEQRPPVYLYAHYT